MAGSLPLPGWPSFPSVPSMSQETQDYVENMLTQARASASAAVNEARDYISELVQPLNLGSLPSPPTPPVVTTVFTGTLTGDASTSSFGSVSASDPPPLQGVDVRVPDVIGTLETYYPRYTVLNVPSAPQPGSFTVPDAPTLDLSFLNNLPSAPAADYGNAPDLATITIPTYSAPTLAAFDGAVPTFSAAAPSGTVQWTEPAYVGQLATSLKATLTLLLAGGTGIDPAVERQIWDRDRVRVDLASAAKKQQALTEWEARGFALPPGALNGALVAADNDAAAAIATASRDVAIKQAELEQKNREFACTEGRELEGMFVQLFLSGAQRSYDMARFAVEASIQIFNARVAEFGVEQQVFAQQIARWRTNLEYVQAVLTAYRAQVEAEGVKASINRDQVAAYTAKVQAFQAQVQAYAEVVRAATVRTEAEKAKIEGFRAQVEGMTAQVTAKRAEYDAFAAQVQGEVAKGQLEDANARVYSTRLAAITAKGGLALKQADADIAAARTSAEYQIAEIHRLEALASKQLAVVQANVAAYEAATRRGIAQFEANRTTKQLEITATTEANRNIIAKYTADLEQWRTRITELVSFTTIQSDALKAAAQITATLAAGMTAGTSVSTSFNGSVNRGETSSTSHTASTGESESTQHSDSYSVQHRYDHAA